VTRHRLAVPYRTPKLDFPHINAQTKEDTMSTQRTIAAIAACAIISLAAAGTALAHPHIVRATPAVGGTVTAAPNEVTIRFSEKLEPAFSSFVVRDAEGKQVDKGDGALDKKDHQLMRGSLQTLTPGVYKVEWHAVGTDTHKVDGDFTFTVGH
jgi:methionine-rich copper-binding protein CopC